MTRNRLTSLLLGTDNRLQSCLLDDNAHVTVGQRGVHVSRIHLALMMLGWRDYTPQEIKDQLYGPATAKEILRIKTEHGIVARNRQNHADNIVGKMTISFLDRNITSLERIGNIQPYLGVHPTSPKSSSIRDVTGGIDRGRAVLVSAQNGLFFDGESEDYGGLSRSAIAIIKRSNKAKTPGSEHLRPILDVNKGSVPDDELKHLVETSPISLAILKSMFSRMERFQIDRKIKVIFDIWTGDGSKGFRCEVFDHNDALRHMEKLTFSWLYPAVTSFCRDAWNCHGPRDSFREMRVVWGEGLHICITQPAERGKTPCEFHIDTIQQGGVCYYGYCLPVTGCLQTIGHLITVGPWFAKEALKYLKEHKIDIQKLLKNPYIPL